MRLFDHLSWPMVVVLTVGLGLAPFMPPHIWDKLQMLMAGRLSAPLDIFDLVMHAVPFGLLLGKMLREWGKRRV